MGGRCGDSGEDLREMLCRNSTAASHLKLLSLAAIFIASVVGISSPVLLARRFKGSSSYATAVLLIKCYAAGVILSTSLVHVLPDAFEALSDCAVAVRHPWRDFPFSGLVCLIGALLALLVDAAAASHAEEEQSKPRYEPIGKGGAGGGGAAAVDAVELGCHVTHSHSNHRHHDSGGAGHDEENDDVDDAERAVREKQRLVSKVLEIGIIFHSVIIGVTMGMSQNQCTIRPLIVALSFHQVFEGMGLGGCIAQAGFGVATTSYMCIMFSVTTPMGIVLGMMIFYLTGYDDSSPNALISEGLLGSLSAGVLVYMALVDLIAVDFFHNKKMSSDPKLKKACFVALVLGSASMSILALWA